MALNIDDRTHAGVAIADPRRRPPSMQRDRDSGIRRGHATRSFSVFVVEDDPVVAAVHSRYVSRRPGFAVSGRAARGDDALRSVRLERPDIVLLDLELPGLSGIDFLRAVRRDASAIEVVVVTAHTSPRLVQMAMQLGAVDYLAKPFPLARLGEALGASAARIDAARFGIALSQDSIDQLRAWTPAAVPATSVTKRGRLAAVRTVLAGAGRALTAAEVASEAKMARVTARRYLEHLVSIGHCTVDTLVDGPGRPRKAYRLWLSGPVAEGHAVRAARRAVG